MRNVPRLTNTQFSEAEITAIVEEAAAHKAYVCAHAYNSDAIARCVKCGVRSIEHGNLLDEPTAQLMKVLAIRCKFGHRTGPAFTARLEAHHAEL